MLSRESDAPDVLAVLRQALRQAEAEAEKIQEKVKGLKIAIRALGGEPIPDKNLIRFLREKASPSSPLSTHSIAKGTDVNGRNLARHLKKMADDKRIGGDPRGGYYALPEQGER